MIKQLIIQLCIKHLFNYIHHYTEHHEKIWKEKQNKTKPVK